MCMYIFLFSFLSLQTLRQLEHWTKSELFLLCFYAQKGQNQLKKDQLTEESRSISKSQMPYRGSRQLSYV